jgi:hypothetical protein
MLIFWQEWVLTTLIALLGIAGNLVMTKGITQKLKFSIRKNSPSTLATSTFLLCLTV